MNPDAQPSTNPPTTEPGPAEVAVVVSSYNASPYLPDCIESLLASRDQGVVTRLVIVDNASTDDTATLVAERFPGVDLVRVHPNRGFTAGQNAGWAHARAAYPNVAFVVALNVDTVVESGWLVPLVQTLQAHPRVGAAQSKLRLHPETDRLNSAGNRCHYLGFGFVTACGQVDDGRYDQTRSIDFASGAAVMVRRDLLERLETLGGSLFDEQLYMYLEDTDLSWKLRAAGYDTWFVPASVVYHKYKPTAPSRYYYYLERNRWLMLLSFYRWPTLLLLSPALATMEIGQWLYALAIGRLGDKLAGYAWFWRPSGLAATWRRRRLVQRSRVVGDRQLMGRFSGRIDFAPLAGPLMRYVANPLLGAYWAVARRLIRW